MGQGWVNTDRYTQVHRQRQTEILTVSMFCMMSWKVGWLLKEAESMMVQV